MERMTLDIKIVIISSLAAIFIGGCAKKSGSPGAENNISASGADFGIANMSDETFSAIKAACNDPQGASDVGLTTEECYLVMAGSSVRESSWNAKKSCEAWGSPNDPCCGLTQSRRDDARAVGLTCTPSVQSVDGYKCNVLAGLRNLGCKASNGDDCKRHSSDGSLFTGVKKHLGGNTGALSSYVQDMRAIYERSDVRNRFAINPKSLRAWDTVFYASRNLSSTSVMKSLDTLPANNALTGANAKATPATVTSVGDEWVDSYSKRRFPYCTTQAIDPDHDGWGWENNKSCKVR